MTPFYSKCGVTFKNLIFEDFEESTKEAKRMIYTDVNYKYRLTPKSVYRWKKLYHSKCRATLKIASTQLNTINIYLNQNLLLYEITTIIQNIKLFQRSIDI